MVVSQLTRRQWQIATLIVRGLTNADIGAELGLSGGTVANHVQHIMKRLGVGSRVEIAVWTVRVSGKPDASNAGQARRQNVLHGKQRPG